MSAYVFCSPASSSLSAVLSFLDFACFSRAGIISTALLDTSRTTRPSAISTILARTSLIPFMRSSVPLRVSCSFWISASMSLTFLSWNAATLSTVTPTRPASRPSAICLLVLSLTGPISSASVFPISVLSKRNESKISARASSIVLSAILRSLPSFNKYGRAA